MKFIQVKRTYYLLLLLSLMQVRCSREFVEDIFLPDFEVFVVLPAEGLGDRSFVDAIYEGVESAKKDFDFSVSYLIPESLSEGEQWIEQIPILTGSMNQEALIIVAGSQFKESIDQLDGNVGKHKILFLGGIALEDEHIASVVYKTYAASYIGAYLSAQLVPDCRARVVAGFDASFLKEYQAGFQQGVLDAGGSVDSPLFVSDGFSGFEMPDSAYQLTQTILPDNNLILALSAGSNFGIINAARNYPEQRYVIGVDADQSWMGLKVVTGSIVKLFSQDIRDYIEDFSKGTFIPGSFYRSMEEGKAAFIMNKEVMAGKKVSTTLLNLAIEKEKAYWENKE